MWFFHNSGILGINARNLIYIRAYNPKKAVMLADSKLKTKNFLAARDIPVAKLYAAIEGKKQLENFDWSTLPSSFVVKPNAGYGGEGILVIKGKKGSNWIKSNDTIMTQEELAGHISDILDGRYSLADISDIALFEQRLEAPDLLKKMSYKGLPDIRIVTHNLIPVMAMLRVPTEESQGKANIHLGGIGIGIDIAKGELTHITQYNKKIDGIPGFGEVRGIKIPHWEEFLLIASKVQQITNLGFAAIDLVLDKNMGPALLEINARAGLAVQIANLAPLRRRLERIQGIKVTSPEKGVRIAQDIFGHKIEEKKEEKKKTVIGNMEWVEVIGKKSNSKLIAQMNLDSEKTILDNKIAEKVGLEEGGKCKFNLAEKRITTIVETKNLENEKYKMQIGSRDLRDFLIDPTKHIKEIKEVNGEKQKSTLIKRTFTERELNKIDDELYDIDSKIKLLSNLKPSNLKEEYTKFLVNPKTYNPQFEYKPLSFDPNNLISRLNRLEFPESPIGILWQKKADEIKRKIELLKSRGQEEEFTKASIRLYGTPDFNTVNNALEEIFKMPKKWPDEEKEMTAKEAKKIFENAIHEYGLKGWKVNIKEDLVSDVIAGKHNSIMIRKDARFTEKRLKGTIAHELETHAFTAMNGALQPYKIFQRGLADYLTTEEGLAVYNQEKTESNETEKKYWPTSSVIGIATGLKGSFSDIYNTLTHYGFGSERAWKVALKAKRGLSDTGKPGAFTKDFIYYKGHEMILDFIKKGGNLKDLYYGKTNVSDLDIIKKVKGLKTPVYLPHYLIK